MPNVVAFSNSPSVVIADAPGAGASAVAPAPGAVAPSSKPQMTVEAALEQLGVELKCPVCLSLLGTPCARLPCSHYFCKECIDAVIARGGRDARCPCCKVPTGRRQVSNDEKMDRTVHLYKKLEWALDTQIYMSQQPGPAMFTQMLARMSGRTSSPLPSLSPPRENSRGAAAAADAADASAGLTSSPDPMSQEETYRKVSRAMARRRRVPTPSDSENTAAVAGEAPSRASSETATPRRPTLRMRMRMRTRRTTTTRIANVTLSQRVTSRSAWQRSHQPYRSSKTATTPLKFQAHPCQRHCRSTPRHASRHETSRRNVAKKSNSLLL
ncbi:breast cancer 1, early onset [Pycnococcus provasolii]|uniref:Breast cancer 1, early onset n=1 Tax=Pycnococcus provasolii TaxID=41880 RepID=A0A830HFS3_9CHLO|nr:breast cancer 1, early onset [Pycnococcus provasolii]|mmetsp:Transcript_2228/g.6007  ORF Transcript_2228/g.6007 Transcript_2228/m.6007 type:complete len:326 (+) Transcript_2228:85-1062(+)